MYSPVRFVISMTVGLLLVSGCSGSNSSGASSPAGAATADSMDATTAGTGSQEFTVGNGVSGGAGATTSSANDLADDETNGVTAGDATLTPATLNSTKVNFDITVPVYVSDSLQVILEWGEKSLVAAWVADESWIISDNFPTNTEQPLTVTFFDNNGALVLASFEQPFKTGLSPSENYSITADKFEISQWDDDGDGVSNFDEALAGTDPTSIDITEPLQATLELVPDKIFRISWQPVKGAQFYRVLENSDGVSGFTAISDDLSATTRQFDHRVALLKKLNASYIVQACSVNSCTDSVALQIPEAIDSAATYFKASNANSEDVFGGAISLSADGNTLAVGATGESSTATGINGDQDNNSHKGAGSNTILRPGAGAVYVFQRVNSQWQQEAYIKPSGIGPSDKFGGSVDISADGSTLVVGAHYQGLKKTSGYPTSNSSTAIIGAAYVFRRTGGTWKEEAKFKPDVIKKYDFFAEQVSVSGDGDTVAVISSSDIHYVYKRNNGNWLKQADLTTKEGDECRRGDSVALSHDGNTMIVGSSGTVKVYVRNGDNWKRQTCLRATYPNVAAKFGDTVNLSADGNTIVVSAYNDEGAGVGINGSQEKGDASGYGAVFVFVQLNKVWMQSTYIKSDNAQSTTDFGRSMALSADAKTLVIASSEGIHIYVRENENWQQLTLLERGRVPYFHGDLSISADGNSLAGGSPGSDSAATGINGYREDASAIDAGAVYLY